MSVRAADIRTHLKRLFLEESQQLARLQQLLKGETEILRGDDTAAIERIGADRHDCTTLLTRLDAERRELCHMLSFDTGRAGFDQLLRWCDAGEELRSAWLNNLAVARRCKEHNDRNGAIVGVKLNHVQKLLLAIRGGSEPDVYSNQPRAFAGQATRELGRA